MKPTKQPVKSNVPKQRQPKQTKPKASNKPPVAQTKPYKNPGKPKITRNPDGSIRIKFKEYVLDLTASAEVDASTGLASASPFEAVALAINPGLSSLFPFLSILAQGYEMYQAHEVSFMVEPVCPTTTQGSVMAAIDFDSADGIPLTKNEMMAMAGASRNAPWSETCCRAHKKDFAQSKDYFIRDGPLPATEDIKLSDIGNFILATSQILGAFLGATETTEVPVGELYVDYDITLKKPTLERAHTAQGSSMYILGFGGSVTGDLPFGSNPGIEQDSVTPAFDYDDITGEFTCLIPGMYFFFIRQLGTRVGTASAFTYDPVSGTPVYTGFADLTTGPTSGKADFGITFVAQLGDRITFKVTLTGGTPIDCATQALILSCDYAITSLFNPYMDMEDLFKSYKTMTRIRCLHPKFPSRKGGNKLTGTVVPRYRPNHRLRLQ